MLDKVSMLGNLLDRMRLPFRKDKELCFSLYRIIGFYPHDISYYKMALLHKSVTQHSKMGKRVNNERLEFLGDAILDAAVGDIVYRHFPGKKEGFLTNTRSKIVQRDTLNKLAKELGINDLILSNGCSSSHNSYMGGNAFEALVGAIYLDRGYDACMQFLKKRILAQVINIDKVAYKEVNFKSKLIEWSQKNRIKIDFELLREEKDKNGSPIFSYQVILEGIVGCEGTGFSKKESQQKACKETIKRLRHEAQFIDNVFAAKTSRTQMEEEPVETPPEIDEPKDFIIIADSSREDESKHPTVFKEKVYTEDENIGENADNDSSSETELSEGNTDPKLENNNETKTEDIIELAENMAFSERDNELKEGSSGLS